MFFFNIYFLKFLGFVIRKLHFHVMDSKIIHASCMGAAITVIAIGVTIIEQERNTIYIQKEPRINTIAQREFYIDSILNQGDRYCVKQIHMKPVVIGNRFYLKNISQAYFYIIWYDIYSYIL